MACRSCRDMMGFNGEKKLSGECGRMIEADTE